MPLCSYIPLPTPGEFVIKKSRVAQLGSQFLQGVECPYAFIFHSLSGSTGLTGEDGGGLTPALAGRYASGGLVPAYSTPVIREVPYILSTKVSGKDLNLTLERFNLINNKRKS